MVIGIFSHFFALETTLAERQFFRALARLVGRRAARLSACGIAAIVSKMGYLDEGCAVGADGSLYNVRRMSLEGLFTAQLESILTLGVIEISRLCGEDTRGAGRHLWREGTVSFIALYYSQNDDPQFPLVAISLLITPKMEVVSVVPLSLVRHISLVVFYLLNSQSVPSDDESTERQRTLQGSVDIAHP